ncbi:MAG TPA: hemerythrin domain-containing protein [Fibrobacteria bacterium]|jgi:hypothetical protein|nr:hemerythrin domain-containing protein [Fibrobacteria bacterium]
MTNGYPMKTDLYTFVHKAQRRMLFALSERIARADFSDAADTTAVDEALREALDHLREHAAIEEHYIHPLYRALGSAGEGLDVAAEFDAEHELLEREIEALGRIAGDARWNELHRAYNGFLGRYLVHLEEEEAAQEAVLWKHYDAELAEVFARFQRERAPEKLRDDLEMFLPALSAPELTKMFAGMKLRAPDPVFQFAQGLAAEMTPPEIWAKVKAAISNPTPPSP